jgi:DNA-directed RNA polymerase specialized sigma24 family protein
VSGIPLHPWYRRRDGESRAAIVKRYQEGASLAACSREFGTSVGTVKRYLRDAGVELRPNYRHNPFSGAS